MRQPNEFTKLALRYPVAYGAANRLLLAVLMVFISRTSVMLATVVGALFGAAVWWLRRPTGLATRRERYDGSPVNAIRVLRLVLPLLIFFTLAAVLIALRD